MNSDVEARFDEFHRRIKRGDIAAIRYALESGISPNLENRFGWTLLMLAASEGNLAIGQLLITSGADVNKATSMGVGQTALTLAVVGGHVRFLKLLLEHGANPDTGGHPLKAWLLACRLPEKSRAEILATIGDYRAQKPN